MKQKVVKVLLTMFVFISIEANHLGDSTHPLINNYFLVENKGQWPENVLFLSKQGNVFYWILEDGMVIDIGKVKDSYKNQMGKYEFPNTNGTSSFERHVVKLHILNGKAKFYKTIKENNVTFNFFKGNDPSKYATGVKSYKEIILKDVYQGIDAKYDFTPNGELRFAFIVHPGADPSKIQFAFEGQNKLDVSSNDIKIQTKLGEVKIGDIAVVQKGDTLPVYFKYRQNTIGFSLPTYDKNDTMIIDPTLRFSSFLGGNNEDYINGLSKIYDWVGNYFCGSTRSTDFPFIGGYDQSFNGGNFDAFVGWFLLYDTVIVTYLGGSGNDYCRDILSTHDVLPNIIVSGVTYSSDFPITVDAFQTQHQSSGYSDGFITRFNYALSNLLASTFLGGNNDDNINALDVDGSGIYVAGNTKSSNFPVTQNAYQSIHSSVWAGFVSKLPLSLDTLIFSTFLQGNNEQDITGLRVINSKPIVAGHTNSLNFPVTSGTFQTQAAGIDIFVTRFNSDGSNIEKSARFGGNLDDFVTDLEIDETGQPFICGNTASYQNFPLTNNAIQNVFRGGGWDGFLIKLDSSFSHLLYGTYFGGSGADYTAMINREPYTKNVYIVGTTSSYNFPVTPNAFQLNYGGSYDGFILKISPEGEIIKHYATYVGKDGPDMITGISTAYVCYNGNEWYVDEFVVGYTNSYLFYTLNALQNFKASWYDGFMMKMRLPNAIAINFEPDIACEGDTMLIKLSGTNFVSWDNNLPSDPTVSVIAHAGQTYTVSGWINYDTITIQFTLPVEQIEVNVNPPIANICDGQTIQLLANGAHSYLWQPLSLTGPQITIAPDSSLTLSVIGTSTHGCKDTAEVNVVVNYPPSYELVSSPTTDHQTVCLGDSIQKIEYLLNHINTVSYQPNSFPAGVNASFNISTNKLTIQGKPYMSGTYVYGVEGSGYCGSLFFNGLIQVDQCAGIENYSSENDNKVIVTTQYVYLDIDKPMTLLITDAQGKRVKIYEIDASSQIIDISDLARGIYFFNFHNGTNVFFRKMVIKS